MKELNELDADSILDDEVFIELYEIEDPIEHSKRKVQLGRRAKALGVKSDFDEMIKGYNQADREMKRQEKRQERCALLTISQIFQVSTTTCFVAVGLQMTQGYMLRHPVESKKWRVIIQFSQ